MTDHSRPSGLKRRQFLRGAAVIGAGAVAGPLLGGTAHADPRFAKRRAAGGAHPWSATYESGSFDDWTWWKRPEFDAGEFSVISSGTDGVVAHGGCKLAKFATTQAQVDSGLIHAKLYKEWAVAAPETQWTDDAGRPLAPMANKDASGTYSSWFYIPSDVQWPSGWTNIFQYKSSWPNADGASVSSEPQWWVDAMAADAWNGFPGVQRPRRADGSLPADKEPLLVISNWTEKRADGSTPNWQDRLIAPPVDQWFKITSRVDQGVSNRFALDGETWFIGNNSEWPVGMVPTPTHPTNDYSGWIFGVGNYGGPSRIYSDDARFRPLHPAHRCGA